MDGIDMETMAYAVTGAITIIQVLIFVGIVRFIIKVIRNTTVVKPPADAKRQPDGTYVRRKANGAKETYRVQQRPKKQDDGEISGPLSGLFGKGGDTVSDSGSDWLAKQRREEARSWSRMRHEMSAMEELRNEHFEDCDAEELTLEHEEDCDAEDARRKMTREQIEERKAEIRARLKNQ